MNEDRGLRQGGSGRRSEPPDRPGHSADGPLGRPVAQRLRPPRRRAGAPPEGRRRRGRGRPRLDGREPRARVDPQGPGHGRRPRRCWSPTRRPPAPTSWPPATCSRPRSQAESPDLVLFGQQASDGDGAVLWAAVADRLQHAGGLADLRARGRRRAGHRQAPDRVRLRHASAPRCPRCSRWPTPSTSRATPRSRASWAPRRSRRTRRRSRTSASRPDRAGEAGSRTTVIALGEPPSRGDTHQDRGRRHRGAQKILDFLMERKLV